MKHKFNITNKNKIKTSDMQLSIPECIHCFQINAAVT